MHRLSERYSGRIKRAAARPVTREIPYDPNGCRQSLSMAFMVRVRISSGQ
ncbi:hypothetical protein CLOM621_08735 [Clostridium sp. M62/1]|nr:hypothetical protein CLOM621_08735 [Clostridium sp. M62/1]